MKTRKVMKFPFFFAEKKVVLHFIMEKKAANFSILIFSKNFAKFRQSGLQKIQIINILHKDTTETQFVQIFYASSDSSFLTVFFIENLKNKLVYIFVRILDNWGWRPTH